IVGIVRSVRHRGLDVEPQPEYYIPVAQRAESSMILAVRSTQDPRSLTSAVRREIQSIDPDQPIANVRTLDAVTADSIAPLTMSGHSTWPRLPSSRSFSLRRPCSQVTSLLFEQPKPTR